MARLLRDAYPSGAAFHAQQAAEKAVKALWIRTRGKGAPRVHDVEGLLRELCAPPRLRGYGANLTDGYLASRYPPAVAAGDLDPVTGDEAEDRLREAEEIVAWVRQGLPEE
jgi:HEPN domain-containing protein